MAVWVWMAFIPISFYKRVKRSCAAPNGCCFIPKERSLESMRRKDSSDLFCIRFLWKIKSGEREETKTRGSFLEIVSRFFRKNKSGHLVAGSQPAMISDSRSSSAFKR